MLDTIALYIGYFVIIATIATTIAWGFSDCYRLQDVRYFGFFGFGLFWFRKNTKTYNNVEKMRGAEHMGLSVGHWNVFFNAPKWFNRHVYNLEDS